MALISTSIFTWPLLMCVSVSIYPDLFLRKDTKSLDLGPILIQYDLLLTWSHLQRPYFKIRSHSLVPRVRTSLRHVLWGDTIQLIATTSSEIYVRTGKLPHSQLGETNFQNSNFCPNTQILSLATNTINNENKEQLFALKWQVHLVHS